ncbi:MAG: hypothetical protein Q7S02_02240 [bacterium]|nr:hypothetical protein [bacterium]
MHEFLQWIGGGCYLLNKVFFAVAERTRNRGDVVGAQRWRIAAWAVYLVGLPPWVIILVSWRNWIAAAVEASGAPAMALGLILAWRGDTRKPPRWLNILALVCAALGFAASIADFGGITTLNQKLEIGLVSGFLVGTNLLAHGRTSGYLWFVLMHVSCGWLMWIQGYPWLLGQQVASFGFIVYAYAVRRRRAPVPGTA